MTGPVSKLLVANRGEIAVRIARTCREMGIATIAVHSDPDADAPHVRACDEAVAIGGDTPATSYLRVEALLEAAARTGADAVHPGYGFLAENAGFARAVVDAGLTWVGPPPDAIAAMGDKLEAKRRMAAADVPLLPSVAVEAGAELAALGDEVGFPLMVKAAAGGGGTGMRVVGDAAALAEEVAAAQREAGRAFGDDRVFLERFVTRPRHVEVQILADVHGRVVHLWERECSVQRRHQKVVEESPSPRLDAATREELCETAVEAARAIGYVNAGTVEFVLDDVTGEFAFLEVNTRLQVEHPVTEAVTGLDLVRLQLLVARGEPLPFAQAQVRQDDHAIEVRLYAEDPGNGYLPASGTLLRFTPDAAAGGETRWDTGVETGTVVSTFYDPMLAKVVAHAPTRGEAAARLARALERTVIQGVVTNRDLLVRVLRDEAFLAGDTTTAYLDERFPTDTDRRFPPDPDAAVRALLSVVADGFTRSDDRAGVLATIPPGFSNTGLGPSVTTVTVGGGELRAETSVRRDGTLAVTVGEVEHEVVAHGARDGGLDLSIDGRRGVVVVDRAGDSVQVVLPDANVTLFVHPRFPHRAGETVAGATLAPMPGSVVAVAVEVGQSVAAGDLLVTVEAMKMEHRVTAPFDGEVAEVRVTAGQQVDADEVLVVVADPT